MPHAGSRDTIAAVATAPGAGGVGIVRISGARARQIGEAICARELAPRHAHYARFFDADTQLIDDGLALYFQAPASYTGEDVVELHGHGSPVLLATLLRRCLELGARSARPGEFTERAYLEGKLDLAQAEAVADLIAAGSQAAARAARRSLEGEFSRHVDALVEQLTQLRMYVEAALDFPDEQIDFLAAPALAQRLQETRAALDGLLDQARHGRRLLDGLHVLILGAPNVGKSSLLNALAAQDRAIVSDIAGTTRDLLRETVQLDGVQLTLVDSAGLRESPDAIEAEGIRRARAELQRADVVLVVGDAQSPPALAPELRAQVPEGARLLWLHNKCDQQSAPAGPIAQASPAAGTEPGENEHWAISARSGAGLDALRERLRELAGGQGEGSFSARERHVQALRAAQTALAQAADQIRAGGAELAAEELRQAQLALSGITGPLDADALLGRIFAGFCIGK
jgi:tRNA modification GTPase